MGKRSLLNDLQRSQPRARQRADGVIELAVIGTDTEVGKTHVVRLLVQGLRALGRRVWVHKPVACGGWADGQAEDGRALAGLCGDGQPLTTICPEQFPTAASPHLAARVAGCRLAMGRMTARIARLRSPAAAGEGRHDLVLEGVGGLLVPLTPRRQTLCDLLARARLPVLVVARTAIGTLNHTALTVAHARSAGLDLIGLVVNAQHGQKAGLAETTAVDELRACTSLPVLAQLPYRAASSQGLRSDALVLARALLAWQEECPDQDR